MAYTVYKASGFPVTVPDNAIDTTFFNNAANDNKGIGVQLVGRNAINYGAAVAQNFLQITENFASTALLFPTDATALQGQLWFDITNDQLNVRVTNNTSGGINNWRPIVTSDRAGNIVATSFTGSGAGLTGIPGTAIIGGGSFPVINPLPGVEKSGDIRVAGSIISIWASGAWRQIFPAVYS